MQYMLEAGNPLDSVHLASVLKKVIATDDFSALKTNVYETFSDMRPQEAGLTDAFKHLIYYFPSIAPPPHKRFFLRLRRADDCWRRLHRYRTGTFPRCGLQLFFRLAR